MTRRMHLARSAAFAPNMQFEFGLARSCSLTLPSCPLQLIYAATLFRQSMTAFSLRRPLPVKQSWLFSKVYQSLLGSLLLLGVCLTTGQAQTLTSAADILDKAKNSESAAVQNLKTPLRRYFRLEERSLSGTTLARFGVEVWHGKEGRIISTRFYDTNNALVAGDWQLSDGSHRTYAANQTPRIINTAATPDDTNFNRSNIWRFPPSAQGFKDLLKHSRQTVVEENATSYTVDMRLEDVAASRGLVKAKLMLRRADYLPVQATLLVENTDAITEYSFAEIPVTEWPARETPPEAVLLDALLTDGKAPAVPTVTPAAPSTATTRPTPDAVAKNNSKPVTAKPTPVAPAPPPQPTPAAPAPSPTPIVPAPPAPPASPAPTNVPALYEVGSLQGRAIRREAPIYPKVARNAQLGGLVKVFVELDERGNITKITNAEGPSLLQAAAIQAARGWRFTPVVIDGRPVRALGYILFQFTP